MIYSNLHFFSFSFRYILYNVDIESKNLVVASTTRSKHRPFVKSIVLKNGTMWYLPNGIGERFPYLKDFSVLETMNLRLISRPNFKQMENVRNLAIQE